MLSVDEADAFRDGIRARQPGNIKHIRTRRTSRGILEKSQHRYPKEERIIYGNIFERILVSLVSSWSPVIWAETPGTARYLGTYCTVQTSLGWDPEVHKPSRPLHHLRTMI